MLPKVNISHGPFYILDICIYSFTFLFVIYIYSHSCRL